ncbi:MAG TPA: 4Fe-4S dicluster domain-containing protein [Candidatus Limnocylindrales bacterium]
MVVEHSGADAAPDSAFLEEVMGATAVPSRLDHCIQCGTCGGSCPSGPEMDHTPRQLFALIRAGRRDAVLSSNAPWMCVSCYYCVVRCPQAIQITDVMYALKTMATRAHAAGDRTASDFSRLFIWNVEHFGRSYEVGLVGPHYLRHHLGRLPGVAPMGIGLLAKGRIPLAPARIKGLAGLHAILARAAELEAAR